MKNSLKKKVASILYLVFGMKSKKTSQHTKYYKPNTAGFTLLLATLTASLLLILGASMFNLAQKQVLLSSLGRDSQFAFYAADTAAECALYWDLRFNLFSSSTPMTSSCDSQNLTVTTVSGVSTFEFQPSGYCARVTITKQTPSPGVPGTIIDARGYSVSCVGIENSDRALERAVKISF